MHLYTAREETRAKLKAPLGRLITNDELSRELLRMHLKDCPLIVTVGDATTETLVRMGFNPDIHVIDGREMRAERRPARAEYSKEIHVRNPAGSISEEALKGIGSALEGETPARITVDGEEDLLALPFLALCKDGSAVLYGQPKEGLVIVKVDGEARKMAAGLLKEMGIERKNPKRKGIKVTSERA